MRSKEEIQRAIATIDTSIAEIAKYRSPDVSFAACAVLKAAESTLIWVLSNAGDELPASAASFENMINRYEKDIAAARAKRN